MEGMPRFPALVPDPKEPANEYDDEFVYRLKEYILMHFQADPSDFDSAISEIRHMKSEIMKSYKVKDVQMACVLKRYYAQLLMMKNRFPMESSGELRTPFSWHEQALDIPTAQSIADIGFEMACVMYQIGSIHAAIAAEETRQTEDSIKNAFMHFQYAAWPFQHIRDAMDVACYATSDFDKELLTFHVNVLLGQAQECLLEKSMVDHRSHQAVAKLAAYLRDLYNQCNRVLINSNTAIEFVTTRKMKMWSRTCGIKSEIYGCIAMLYMGYKSEDDQKFGDRLGYCQAAEVHLNRALQYMEKEDRLEMRETVQFVADVVKARLENAKKENDFIYHERIPKIDELLGSVEGLGKVHPLCFDPLDPSVGGEDIFGALIPPTVLATVSEYEEEKAKLKREVMKRVSEKDEELHGFLCSLNSSELGLDSTGPSFQLPDLLLERNASMHSQIDAVPRLLEKLQLVDELARTADSKLTGLTSRLSAINLPEFTSDEGFRAISEEISRLLDHHNQARSNNGELHKALAAHSTNIHLLSLPLHELTVKLAPPSDVPPASTAEGAALVKVLNKAHEMQTQRATLVKRLCDEMEADNISKKLLAERDTDGKATFEAELKKHDQTIKYIDMNLTAQDNILHHLTEANADFAEQRKVIQDKNKVRSEQVMTLVAAFDIYSDICEKANDGKRFYEKLIDRMNRLSQAIEGLEGAFSHEKEKIEGEKRALEQKMAALRAAKEAREAMNDFGGGQGIGGGMQPQQPGVAPKSSRPRLGDYMEFYRNKMGGSRGAPSAQLPPVIQPPAHFPSIHSPGGAPMGFPAQPPSPAPSSIGDFHHTGEDYVFPEPGQRYGSSYGPPPPQLKPQRYIPIQQPSPIPGQWNQPGAYMPQTPREMNTTPQFPQPPVSYQQPYQPNGSNQPTVFTNQPNIAPQPAVINGHPGVQYSHPPVATNTTPSGIQPTETVSSQPRIPTTQGYQQPGRPEPYPPGGYQQPQQMGPNHSPIPSPSTAPNAQVPQHFLQQHFVQPSNQPLPQPYVLPPVPSSTFSQNTFPAATNPPNFSQGPAVSQNSQFSAPNQPRFQAPVPTNSQLQHPGQQNFAPTQPSLSPQNQHPVGRRQQQFSQSPLPPPAANNFHQPPFIPQVELPVSALTPAVINHSSFPGAAPSGNSVASSQPSFPGPSPTPAVSNQPPFPGAAQNQPAVASSPAVNPAVSTQPSFPGGPAPWGAPRNNPISTGPAPSPWHRTQAPSPWHQAPSHPSPGTPGNLNQTAPITPTPASFGSSAPTSGGPPSAQNFHRQPPSQQSSNVDLLSSLLGDLQLPMPIQPSQATTATVPPNFGSGQFVTQNLQRAAAATSSETVVAPRLLQQNVGGMTVVPSSSDSSIGNIRPAAAVLPMQQKVTAAVATERPVLTLVNHSSISVHPQEPQKSSSDPFLPLNDLSNPEKFKLGEGDRSRLEKRQLHTAIRDNAPLPSLDPLDPLNQLDPFWNIRKA